MDHRFWILAFLTSTMFITSDGQLVLEPSEPLTKAEGEDVAVFCTNVGQGQEQPEWVAPDGNLIGTINQGATTHLFVEEDTVNKETKLQITNLEVEDKGSYTCRLSGSLGQTILIDVFVGIEFVKRAEEEYQAFEEFESASIKCSVTGNPKPSIEWYHNNVRVYDDGKYSIDPDVGLTISNITRDDEGPFTCRATIRSLSETKAMDIEVDVQVSPSWLFPPTDEVRAVGTSVEFHCKADGDPEPSYSWTYRQNPIVDDGDKYRLRDDGEYLTINNLDTNDDGAYLCAAANGVNTISEAADLSVLFPPRGNDQDNRTATEGQTVVLQCTVVQGESSLLLWEYEGREMVIGQQPTNSRITVSQSIQGTQLTMTITGVQRSDQGGYTCEIENEVGISRVTHFLFVEYEPTINTTITKDQVYSWVGNPANVTCHWEGYPTPKIIWKKGGWKLNSTDADFYNYGNGSSSAEVTPGPLDFGSYVCEATNKVAKNTHTIDLIQAFVPTEPLGVKKGEVTSTTLEILFEEPEYDGNLPIIGYTVEYWGFDDDETMRDDFNSTEEVKLTGLNPDRTYYFRMSAENDVGLGLWSENATAKTITFRTPREPIIMSPDISSHPTKYDLEWREPEDNGGSPINGYIIRHALVSSEDVEEIPDRYEEAEVGAEARSHIISPLEKDKLYFIELRAVSALGFGEPAEKIIKTAQGNLNPTPKPTPSFLKVEAKVVVAVLVAAFIVILILIDVCCYCVNDCGLLMCLCVQCCGQHTGTHEVDVELAADYSQMGDDVTTSYGDDTTARPSEPSEADTLMKDGGTL
ncbi:neural cell adhesion molecule 2-like isoform X4 [Apostichopus japonicus]|uniref:neural cell adhesion molecule 2-like isoform X4 n=1 Tax=Stichopus japonicus TaxID=307972 RepID=UPI003AB1E964